MNAECRIGLSETGLVDGVISLSASLLSEKWFSSDPISVSSKIDRRNWVTSPQSNTSSIINSQFPNETLSSKSDTSMPMMAKSCFQHNRELLLSFPLFIYSLLIGSDWDASQVIVQTLLPRTSQGVSSSLEFLLERVRKILDKSLNISC